MTDVGREGSPLMLPIPEYRFTIPDRTTYVTDERLLGVNFTGTTEELESTIRSFPLTLVEYPEGKVVEGEIEQTKGYFDKLDLFLSLIIWVKPKAKLSDGRWYAIRVAKGTPVPNVSGNFVHEDKDGYFARFRVDSYPVVQNVKVRQARDSQVAYNITTSEPIGGSTSLFRVGNSKGVCYMSLREEADTARSP